MRVGVWGSLEQQSLWIHNIRSLFLPDYKDIQTNVWYREKWRIWSCHLSNVLWHTGFDCWGVERGARKYRIPPKSRTDMKADFRIVSQFEEGRLSYILLKKPGLIFYFELKPWIMVGCQVKFQRYSKSFLDSARKWMPLKVLLSD